MTASLAHTLGHRMCCWRFALLMVLLIPAALPRLAFACTCAQTEPPLTVMLAPMPAIVCAGAPVTFTAYSYDEDILAYPACTDVVNNVTYRWFVDGAEVSGQQNSTLTTQWNTGGTHSVSCTVDDVGSPVREGPVSASPASVCVVDATLQGVPERLFHKCEGTPDSATITINPHTCPNVTVTWTVTGPIEKVSQTETSVTIRATDPAPGQCSGTLTCAIGDGCTASVNIQVSKPTSLTVADGAYACKHQTFNNTAADTGGTCVKMFWNDDVLIYGWVWDICYQVRDQCGRIMDVTADTGPTEAWSGGFNPQTQNNPEITSGIFCDCISVTSDEPVTEYPDPVTGTQAWSLWGCPLGTITWTVTNTDASRTGP